MKKCVNAQKIFYCDVCDIKCSRKYDFDRHLSTQKHVANDLGDEKMRKKDYICNLCDKNYKSGNGLWKHKKKCNLPNNIKAKHTTNTFTDPSSNEIKVMTGLMVEIVKSNNDLQKQTQDLQKQNQDLQKQVLEICQKIQPSNTIINTNSNNNNKTFNLQFFLNEECKDAMNLSEFVNSIQLKLSDLENIGKLGYVEGISNIIIKELNDTEINKRPVHCSDAKRETLYVKEENKWEKDTDETKQMVRAVRDVDKKASKLLMTDWKDTHPKCTESNSCENKEFIKLAGQVNDGDGKNVKKVIKKVAKEIIIEK